MYPESAIMQNNDRNSNSTMPDRLYGEHYPDSFLDMPRPVRESNVATLGDYIRHLQEVDKQPDQSNVASQSVESSFEHICPNNPILTCNCTDPKFCAEQPDNNGWIKCPDSGKLCSVIDCPDGCKGDNLEYVGNPYPKRQDSVGGWPCVVVGAVCETWVDTSECISRGEHSAGHTEQHTDAGLDNDGPAATTKL
jgi:hypothetical protein